MRKEYVPFRKRHEQTSAEGEDGAGEGKNESFSWPEWSDGRGWGRRRARMCFLARLQRAADTSQGILSCACQPVGGLEGFWAGEAVGIGKTSSVALNGIRMKKIPVLVSPLDCSQALGPQKGQALMTDCLVITLWSLHLSHLVPWPVTTENSYHLCAQHIKS